MPPPTSDTGVDQSALYRDALAAIHEALDIPHAATVGWEEKRQQILDRRITHAVVALEGILDARPAELLDRHSVIAFRIAYLRERLAEHPAEGYVTQSEADAALGHGATWSEAVAEPRDATICGPGCCSPALSVHASCPGPLVGRTVVSVR